MRLQGLIWRRILPAVSVTGLGAWSISANAKCQQYESYAACSKTCIAPMSAETGRPYEETAYWSALANSMTHQVCTFKNCSSMRLKFLQHWENYPGKNQMSRRSDESEKSHHVCAVRHSFPPRIKTGETQTQVINTSNNIKALTIYQIQGTEKILAMVHYGAKGERDEVIATYGEPKRYRNVYRRFTPVNKGIGIYVGPKMLPHHIWDMVYGEDLKGKIDKVEGEGYAYFYDDTDDPNLSCEADINDEKRVRIRAGFTSPFKYECKIVLEEI